MYEVNQKSQNIQIILFVSFKLLAEEHLKKEKKCIMNKL